MMESELRRLQPPVLVVDIHIGSLLKSSGIARYQLARRAKACAASNMSEVPAMNGAFASLPTRLAPHYRNLIS